MNWAEGFTYITISGTVVTGIVTVIKHLKQPAKLWEQPVRALETKIEHHAGEIGRVVERQDAQEERVEELERNTTKAIERLSDKIDRNHEKVMDVLLNRK